MRAVYRVDIQGTGWMGDGGGEDVAGTVLSLYKPSCIHGRLVAQRGFVFTTVRFI
jgi:hypothetical protein